MTKTFRTILKATPSSLPIEHQSGVMCLGSCFAEHMGKRLKYYKFQTNLNPFGIIYNPISIANSLNILMNSERFYEEKDVFENLGNWHSFQHHGSFSNPDMELVLEKINNTLTESRAFLKNTEFLILTFGTANVFVDQRTEQVVANCHKVPQQHFIKKQLSVDEIIIVLHEILQQLNTAFPHLKIITTVSPVRHIRDGLVENQISKSTLILSLNEISKQYPHVAYFPSYELLLDDLRDYRFYEKDMIHPNELAIDYIWDFFAETFFNQKTKDLNLKIEKIKNASNHRPFHANSNPHQSFVKKQLEKIGVLERQYSFLDFEEERNRFSEI